MKPLSKRLRALCCALALALFAAIPAAAQSRTANTVVAVRIQPAASLSSQDGAVELKIRLGVGARAHLWVSDVCLTPPPDSHVVAQSGTYAIPLSTLAGAGGNACMVSTDGELRESVTIRPQAGLAGRDLPDDLQNHRPIQGAGAAAPLLTLAEAERCHAGYVLDRVGGNKQEAAGILGISRNTLYRILKDSLPSDRQT